MERCAGSVFACRARFPLLLIATFFILGGSIAQPRDEEARVMIERGRFAPLYGGPENVAEEREVGPFLIDVYPVTNARYEAFIRANPEWAPERVGSLVGDRNYLK